MEFALGRSAAQFDPAGTLGGVLGKHLLAGINPA